MLKQSMSAQKITDKISIAASMLCLDEVARNHSSFVKNQVPLPGRNYGVKLKVIF